MNKEYVVTVLCDTYNHCKYIRKALDGLLSQVTSFPYVVYVHDDCSTDGTTEIVRDYARRYPGVIRAFLEEKNMYSQGYHITKDLILPYINSKYIAICEGDDYWTDPNKLQRQWEILENHPECDMCACTASVVSEDGNETLRYIRPIEKNGILPIEDVIRGGGQYIATASLFYRSELYKKETLFEKVMSFDYSLQIRGALRGGIYFIDQNMAAYRSMANGSWTVQMTNNIEKRKKHIEREKKMLSVLDEETEGKYHLAIQERIEYGYLSFYEQLLLNKETIIRDIKEYYGIGFLWGRGMRGGGFEAFCEKEGFALLGVCDIKNLNVGELTQYGNSIVDVDYVLHEAKVIFASSNGIYKAIKSSEYKGIVWDLEQYMPWG